MKHAAAEWVALEAIERAAKALPEVATGLALVANAKATGVLRMLLARLRWNTLSEQSGSPGIQGRYERGSEPPKA